MVQLKTVHPPMLPNKRKLRRSKSEKSNSLRPSMYFSRWV